MRTRKCPRCSEVKSVAAFGKSTKRKSGYQWWCKDCVNAHRNESRNTEKGYLKMRYNTMTYQHRRLGRWGRKSKCYVTFEELWAAWEKHKSIYGMRSAWGPGINNLEEHLPVTMISLGKGQRGGKGIIKGAKRTSSNVSIDRLDPNLDYTLQNIIFVRNDENARKNNSSYKDCKIHIRLHEERFIKMKAI